MKEPFSEGFVTIVKDCLICQREVILMDRRGRDIESKIPKGSILPQICEECHQKYCVEMDGVCLINPETGSLAVISKKAFDNIFTIPCPEGRICHAEEKIIQAIIAHDEQAEEEES